MKYQAFVRAAAVVLSAAALSGGPAVAQRSTPAPVAPVAQTMTDTAPAPPEARESIGAIILMQEPVLAQREQMLAAQAREPDTRTMGAASRALQQKLLCEPGAQPSNSDAGSSRSR